MSYARAFVLGLLLFLPTACPSGGGGGLGGDGLGFGGATPGGQPSGGGTPGAPTPGPAPAGGPPRFPIATPIPLEPYRAQGFSFPIPRGFTRRNSDPSRYDFEPASAGPKDITGYTMTYLGRVARYQAPDAKDLLLQLIADRKLTATDSVETAIEYAATTVDTGAPGPRRFVRMMVIRNWDLPYESNSFRYTPGVTQPATIDLFTAELAAPDKAVLDDRLAGYILKSMAWAISIPIDDVPAGELAGIWKWTGSVWNRTFTAVENLTSDPWEPKSFQITFSGGDRFEMVTSFAMGCTEENPCVVSGTAKTLTQGRYVADGGVLTLAPEKCEYRFYEVNKSIRESGACSPAKIPLTLQMRRMERGRISLGGLGYNLAEYHAQNTWWMARVAAPPGPWTSAGPARETSMLPGLWADGTNICGKVDEKEPNDKREETNPYTVGQTVTGCMPAPYDEERWAVAAPASGSFGYFDAEIVPEGKGKMDVNVYIDRADFSLGSEVFSDAVTKTSGQPLYFYWPAMPGQTFKIHMKVVDQEWFKYRLNVVWRPVVDMYEPNDTDATAKPIPVGTPIQAYYFPAFDMYGKPRVESDIYSVNLQPGMATVTVSDVPAGAISNFVLYSPEGRTVAAVRYGSAHSPMITASAMITAAGMHTISTSALSAIGYGSTMTRDAPIVSYKNPYRLLVTQP
jgi:hypothetical protein